MAWNDFYSVDNDFNEYDDFYSDAPDLAPWSDENYQQAFIKQNTALKFAEMLMKHYTFPASAVELYIVDGSLLTTTILNKTALVSKNKFNIYGKQQFTLKCEYKSEKWTTVGYFQDASIIAITPPSLKEEKQDNLYTKILSLYSLSDFTKTIEIDGVNDVKVSAWLDSYTKDILYVKTGIEYGQAKESGFITLDGTVKITNKFIESSNTWPYSLLKKEKIPEIPEPPKQKEKEKPAYSLNEKLIQMCHLKLNKWKDISYVGGVMVQACYDYAGIVNFKKTPHTSKEVFETGWVDDNNDIHIKTFAHNPLGFNDWPNDWKNVFDKKAQVAKDVKEFNNKDSNIVDDKTTKKTVSEWANSSNKWKMPPATHSIQSFGQTWPTEYIPAPTGWYGTDENPVASHNVPENEIPTTAEIKADEITAKNIKANNIKFMPLDPGGNPTGDWVDLGTAVKPDSVNWDKVDTTWEDKKFKAPSFKDIIIATNKMNEEVKAAQEAFHNSSFTYNIGFHEQVEFAGGNKTVEEPKKKKNKKTSTGLFYKANCTKWHEVEDVSMLIDSVDKSVSWIYETDNLHNGCHQIERVYPVFTQVDMEETIETIKKHKQMEEPKNLHIYDENSLWKEVPETHTINIGGLPFHYKSNVHIWYPVLTLNEALTANYSGSTAFDKFQQKIFKGFKAASKGAWHHPNVVINKPEEVAYVNPYSANKTDKAKKPGITYQLEDYLIQGYTNFYDCIFDYDLVTIKNKFSSFHKALMNDIQVAMKNKDQKKFKKYVKLLEQLQDKYEIAEKHYISQNDSTGMMGLYIKPNNKCEDLYRYIKPQNFGGN